MAALQTAMVAVGLLTASMLLIAYLGAFNNSYHEIGLEHYAEKPWGPVPHHVPMPMNTLINIGYLLVGFVWMSRLDKLQKEGRLEEEEANLFYPLLWLSVFYAPVQLGRILTQHTFWAIMDQWLTLPLGGWSIAWGLHLYNPATSRAVTVGVMATSVASYCLTWFSDVGFEIALCLHLLCVVYLGFILYRRQRSPQTLYAFIMGFIAMSMFVFLKIFDLQLADLHPVFRYISGHFLSKIADCMQLYYAGLFAYSCRKEVSKRV